MIVTWEFSSPLTLSVYGTSTYERVGGIGDYVITLVLYGLVIVDSVVLLDSKVFMVTIKSIIILLRTC